MIRFQWRPFLLGCLLALLLAIIGLLSLTTAGRAMLTLGVAGLLIAWRIRAIKRLPGVAS